MSKEGLVDLNVVIFKCISGRLPATQFLFRFRACALERFRTLVRFRAFPAPIDDLTQPLTFSQFFRRGAWSL